MTSTRRVHERIVGELRSRASASITDAELLNRFVDLGDESAFATVVERHAPIVFGLCRRRLGNAADAEDAFQAVFLALARNVRTIRKRASLGAWLYGAAHRVCLTIHREQSRARRDKRASANAQSHDPLAELSAREFMSVIDHELTRLPELLRLPVEMCLVDGLTIEEVASRLNWSSVCVKGRLQRGRERLRRRLTARGVTLGIGLTAATLESATAAVPSKLIASALDAIRGQSLPAIVVRLAGAATPSSSMFGKSAAAAAFCAIIALTAVVGSPDDPAGKPAIPTSPPNPVAKPVPERVDAFGDSLPPGAAARLGTIRFRMGMWPKQLVVSPEGSRFASVAHNYVIHQLTIWNATTGQPIRQVDLPEVEINSIFWLADGRGFALVKVAANDLVMWEFTDEKIEPPVVEYEGAARTVGNGEIRTAALSPNGKLIAAGLRAGDGGNEGKLEVWKLVPNTHVRKMKRVWQYDSPNVFLDVEFTSDGKQVVCATQQQEQWRPGPKPLPNGPTPLVPGNAADVADVSVRDAETGRETVRFSARVGTYRLSPDGRTLFAGGRNGSVSAYDLQTGKARFEISAFAADNNHPSPIRNLAVSPDGKSLIVVPFDGFIAKCPMAAFDTNTGKEIWRYSDDQRLSVYSLAIMPGDQRLVIGCTDGAILFFDPKARLVTNNTRGHQGGIWSVWPEANGRSVITGGGSDCSIRRWDIESGKEASPLANDISPPRRVFDFAPNGKSALAVALVDGMSSISFLDIGTGKLTARLPGDVRKLCANQMLACHPVAWFPDGSCVFSDSGAVAILYSADGREVRRYQPEAGRRIFGIAVSPDGKSVAICGDGPDADVQSKTPGWLQFFDAKSAKASPVWESRTHFVSAAFTPDGAHVILFGTMYRPARPIDQPDAALNLAESVMSFEIATGRGYALFEAPADVLDRRLGGAMAISPSGYRLAVAERDHSITVYEMATGQIRHRFKGHRNTVWQLAFSRDGKRLISASFDVTGLVWDVSPSSATGPSADKYPNHAKEFSDLASADGPTAARGMSGLFADPVGTIKCLKENLRSGAVVTDADLKSIIDQLDASEFRDRESASRKLDALGLLAVPYARRSILTIESAEARRRLTDFLRQHDKHGLLSGARLQERRAVELLEMMDSPDARDLLRNLAAGGFSPLANDSGNALKRLEPPNK